MNTRIGDELICLVCSDRAMGNNFGAISCESCKAFFRRNAHDIEKLRCEFSGKCTITIPTRRHCRRCRLEKCFQVGMRKDWILTEEQLQIRRARIQSRKLREMAVRSNDQVLVPQSSSSSTTNLTSVPHRVSSSSSCSSFDNIEPSSSLVSSTSRTNFHHSSSFHDSSSSSSKISLNNYSNLNDENEESDNEYEELCDKMSKKIFDGEISHNVLNSLLDHDQLDHQNLIQGIFKPHDGLDSHCYQNYGHISQSPSLLSSPLMVPSEYSFPPQIGSHLENPSTPSSSSFHISSSTTSPLPVCSSSDSFSSFSTNHFPDPMGSPFHPDAQSSSFSAYCLSNLVKSEPTNSIEVIQKKVIDLILGSDLSLPINLANEYITSDVAFNQLLNQRMDELINVFSKSFVPIHFEPDASLDSIIRLLDHTAKALISSIKSLESFNRLPLQVRNDLFKESFTSIIIIRSSFLFDQVKGGWQLPGSSFVKFNHVLHKIDTQAASHYLTLIGNLNEHWRRDLKVGLILEAIALFSSRRVDMQNPDISTEKYLYTYLLRRYLESKGASPTQARADCYDLLFKLEQYTVCVNPSEKFRQICSYKSDNAGQLLSEILDLA